MPAEKLGYSTKFFGSGSYNCLLLTRPCKAACLKPTGLRDSQGGSLLRLSIGYGVGLRAFYALGWMALFAVLGCLVFTRHATRKDEDDKIAGFRDRFWYSMTFTVPGFTLVAGDELTVSRRAQCWLYFQRLVCFVLALLAGAAAIGIIRP